MRVNIELTTISRAMKNTSEIMTFSLQVVAMVQKKENSKLLEYGISTNLRNAHLVANIKKKLCRY